VILLRAHGRTISSSAVSCPASNQRTAIKPRAFVAPSSGAIGEQLLYLQVLNGKKGDDIACLSDTD
jgi:hypothetical protein